MKKEQIIQKQKELIIELTKALDYLADNNLIKEQKDNESDNQPLVEIVNKSATLRKDIARIESIADELLQEPEKEETIPIAYEWHNLTTGHCYVDYIPHANQDEKDGYTKFPLFKQDEPKPELTPENLQDKFHELLNIEEIENRAFFTSNEFHTIWNAVKKYITYLGIK